MDIHVILYGAMWVSPHALLLVCIASISMPPSQIALYRRFYVLTLVQRPPKWVTPISFFGAVKALPYNFLSVSIKVGVLQISVLNLGGGNFLGRLFLYGTISSVTSKMKGYSRRIIFLSR